MFEEIQKYCLSLPMVTQDIKWGGVLCFSVGGKLFLVISLDEIPLSASFKVDDNDFDVLSDKQGYIQAPYFAKMKWIKVLDINSLSEFEWQNYIEKAYSLIKLKLSKKLQNEINSLLFK